MQINREDVVQAALTVERWCKTHAKTNGCDCPLTGKVLICMLVNGRLPCSWQIEEFLRKRGLKHGQE